VSSAPPAEIAGEGLGRGTPSPVRVVPPPIPAFDPPAPLPAPAAPPVEVSEESVPPLGGRPAPLLLDVTPHSLCIETVSGYCEPVIKRNTKVPTENIRSFTTAKDNQESVSAHICQGESRRMAENQGLGVVALAGIRPGRRGTVQIEVTFILDADGMLKVQALDRGTGRRQGVQINLTGGASETDVAAMKERQDKMVVVSDP
jgi:molecular chaperone DnaK (HSP70)